MRPAWYEVPQATMWMRSTRASEASSSPSSSMATVPSARRRSPIVSHNAAGCSWISLSMKVS